MNEKQPLDEVYIDMLLNRVVEAGYSELYLDAGQPPRMSGRGTNVKREMSEFAPARPVHIQRMIYDILTDEQIQDFENECSLLFPYQDGHNGQFAVFATRDGGNVVATFHLIPDGKRRGFTEYGG